MVAVGRAQGVGDALGLRVFRSQSQAEGQRAQAGFSVYVECVVPLPVAEEVLRGSVRHQLLVFLVIGSGVGVGQFVALVELPAFEGVGEVRFQCVDVILLVARAVEVLVQGGGLGRGL